MMKVWTAFLLIGVAASVVAWLVALCHENRLGAIGALMRQMRRMPKFGRFVLGVLFVGMWLYGSVKQSGGIESGGVGELGGNHGMYGIDGMGTNLVFGRVESVEGVDNVANSNTQLGNGEWVTGNGSDLNNSHLPSPITYISSLITESDCEAGFVLSGVGYGEEFDFAPPENAVVCEDWLRFGAHEDWFHLPLGWFSFPFGSNVVNALTVLSSGTLYPAITNASTFIAPLKASLGIVPMANWELLSNNTDSSFWHCFTPSNTVLFTWRNALLERDTDKPVSFQCEISHIGDMMFRYDLSSLIENPTTNVLVGLSNGQHERLYIALSNTITSLRWSHLDRQDYLVPDRDGDGISTADEIFIHRTDPGNADTDMDGLSDGEEISAGSLPVGRDSDGDGLVDGSDPDPAAPTSLADIDGDGIPDAYENHWFGGMNAFNSATDRDETGFALSEKILAGINPTNAPSAVHVGNANSLVSWRLFDGFTLAYPQGATNIIWERTFSVNRSSAWQQFFISSSKDSAGHWNLKGMVLEWETNEGTVGSVASSPMGDSFRIPLATNECLAAITLRLRSKGAAVLQMPKPLFLIAYAPIFNVEGGDSIEGKSGRRFSLFKHRKASGIRLNIDYSMRPCNAPMGGDEYDMGKLNEISEYSEDFEFTGDKNGGIITPKRPGTCDLPDFTIGALPSQMMRNTRMRNSRNGGGGTSIIVIDPSSGWRCEGHGYGYDGMGYDWADDYYYEEDSYPLDSSCLRRSWSRGYEGGWNHEYCEVWVSSGMGGDYGYVTSSVEGETGKLFVDGIEVWSSTSEHTYGGDEGSFGGSSEYELGDGCNSCETDCANGNCDSLEGGSLGSFKFRIPLGSPVKGQVSGFVWIASDEPIHIYREMFNVISHPDASIEETDAGGVRRIVSHDLRGRDVRIEDISNGVRITICETQSQKLEHTWEILNVEGNPEQVRLRKISRLDNVMSDETYTYRFGDWVKFDNIAQIETELNISDDFTEYGDGVKIETRTTRDALGKVLKSVSTYQTRIGDFDNAVMREIRREESMGRDWKCTEADYWNDPSHSGRHGQLRLVSGNARAWVYTDFDEQGHETLRIEQRGNAETPADFPYVVSNVLYNASTLENAFVTVKDYAPFDGDDCHADDAAKPRQETRHVVVNGTATVIGRTWTRYTRLYRNGYEAIKKEMWRASSQSAQMEDPSNAYSYEITYADTGIGTPLLMRGAVVQSLDENGVLTENTYSLRDSVLTQISRKSFDGTFNQTYTVTEQDATYGNVLRRLERLTENDVIISDERSTYDEKNRLRSTTYLDGTFITNAYSCCRLLWRQDREGRKVLRSAKTGTDHLYNAEEDVWLAELGNGERVTGNGFRVTQHFFDAIGRETNTVVYAGSAPGEAVEASASDGKVHLCETTEYPYGGDDYAVHTDERVKVTVSRTDILPDSIESADSVFTNGVEVVKTKNRTYFGGGSSMRREWNGNKWTEERRFTDYAADGKRIDYVVTESSDNGVVTNSVSTYDLLGRLVAQETALGTVTYHYDEASPRMTGQTTVAGDIARESTFLYDDHAEQVGVLRDGVTTRTDTTYETDLSNIVCRVTAERTFGESTNACVITKERLTGLSAAFRRYTVKLVGRDDPIAPQTKTEAFVAFDPETKVETETITSSIASTVVQHSRYGVLLSSETSNTLISNSFDALGRVVSTSRKIGEGDALAYQSFDYDVSGDLLATHTYTNIADNITESYAYDMLGNRVETTDALRNTVFRSYDPFGNIISECGATYPVRYTYDTQNRRTSLATTRDCMNWDVTRWTYDSATGLCTSKVYADGSTVIYTYTPDGLSHRTTYPSGRWTENVYNERREVIATLNSDDTENISYARDEFGRVMSEINNVASVQYSLADTGIATNETWMVGSSSTTISRLLDDQGRISFNNDMHFTYADDGELLSLSNEIAKVEYQYSSDRLDVGYSIELANGRIFMRNTVRDSYRRGLLMNITSAMNGSQLDNFTYAYDALNRPATRNSDTFGYNERSEMVEAFILGNVVKYGYDKIGNSTNWIANSLNQYGQLQYDPDGNLLADGNLAFTYDSYNRLKTVSSNDVLLVTNFYDAKSRRVKKVTPNATTVFFYDDWNLIEERIAYANGTTSTVKYYWGKDLSGKLQSAGGVGGLLYLTISNSSTPNSSTQQLYIPCYDSNGNVTKYIDSNGNIVASYTYNAFGKHISKSGALADFFRHRFSTKYFDTETGLYYYGYRFYSPYLMRWLNRDPIEENGGLNLYGFCGNNSVVRYDNDGRAYFAKRALVGQSWSDKFSINSTLDSLDWEWAHEHLFYGTPTEPLDDAGYFGDGEVRSDKSRNKIKYVVTSSGYNDCVMRKAQAQVVPKRYNLVLAGLPWFDNCQSYAAKLRAKYAELMDDEKVLCECFGKRKIGAAVWIR